MDLCVCMVILSHRRLSGFVDSDFAPVLQTLVEAYKEREEETFNTCCDHSVFRATDNEVMHFSCDLAGVCCICYGFYLDC